MTEEQPIDEITAALKPATTPRVKSKLDEARETADRLSSLNAQLEEKLQRLEQLHVESTLSGHSLVRQNQQQEESDADYADRAMRGELRADRE